MTNPSTMYVHACTIAPAVHAVLINMSQESLTSLTGVCVVLNSYNVICFIYFITSCELVQNFLLHVVKVNPSCGQRVVDLAKGLATKMIGSSKDFDCAKENGNLACEFLSKLSSVLALKVPGAFGDLDSLEWHQLPLIPTAQEIHHVSKSELLVKCFSTLNLKQFDHQNQDRNY